MRSKTKAAPPSSSSPPEQEFVPSPMPSSLELWRASLDFVRSGKSANEAIREALHLWAEVLEADSEWTVEVKRLEIAQMHPDKRETAVQRWNTWQRRRLGIEALAHQEKAWADKMRADAAKCFEGLQWPAPFDDVLRRIMDGALGDGKEGERHERFVACWLKHWMPKEENRLRADRDRFVPGISEVLSEAPKRIAALKLLGEDTSAWEFDTGVSGEENSRRLNMAVEQLGKEYAEDTERQVKAHLEGLKSEAANLRSASWNMNTATYELADWKARTAVSTSTIKGLTSGMVRGSKEARKKLQALAKKGDSAAAEALAKHPRKGRAKAKS
jgi:hypothetical protein